MNLSPAMEAFVRHWGETGARWGVNRSIAQMHALLYLSPQDLQAQVGALSQAAPLLRTLASDPSLRGLSRALSLALGGLQAGRFTLDQMAQPLDVIAAPIAYFIMQNWLRDFVYRVELTAGIFLLAILITWLIALLTVTIRSMKTALANPVKSLRTE